MLRHNSYSFLTGDTPFFSIEPVEEVSGRFVGQVLFEPHHEGFIGIPHGGLPMGLCLDAWRRAGTPSYPVRVAFRFGGSGIAIGDSAEFAAEYDDGNPEAPLVVRITKQGDKTPYLVAQIAPAGSADDLLQLPTRPPDEFRLLPYYRNCFVCGHHRTVIGLKRRFRLHEPDGGPVVTAVWGDRGDDVDRARLFVIGAEELHPTVLVSIFDENIAWGGFMRTGAAGLSVRLEFTLLRPVGKYERLLFVGWPTGIRGNPRAPRFFKAQGTILSTVDPQAPEPVAYGAGEWIVVPMYTEQIKENLLPEDDWSWIFSSPRNGFP
ncbi:MAG: hypothetical protein FJY85_09110 [Deltaproteobacteria bacterium]|nr:hypothetical protein [Deltaproteobacteria bacterium]